MERHAKALPKTRGPGAATPLLVACLHDDAAAAASLLDAGAIEVLVLDCSKTSSWSRGGGWVDRVRGAGEVGALVQCVYKRFVNPSYKM